jgi:hypothetical protein
VEGLDSTLAARRAERGKRFGEWASSSRTSRVSGNKNASTRQARVEA